MKGTEQVAAVCYRLRKRRVEFLLVKTRGGRWIFPKGATESGLSNAQAAALEAFEEAGVHGRIEEVSFARYIHRKRKAHAKSAKELLVAVHLCHVTRLSRPKESYRNPTWFPIEKAKERLRQKRAAEDQPELLRVVDLALGRIHSFERCLRAAEPEIALPAAPGARVFSGLSFRRTELAAARTRTELPRLLRLPLLKGNQTTREAAKVSEVISINNRQGIPRSISGGLYRAARKNSLS